LNDDCRLGVSTLYFKRSIPADSMQTLSPARRSHAAAPDRTAPPADASPVDASPADLGTHGSCTCFHIRRLARRVTQFYDRALAPSGLRVTQYSLLTRLLRDAIAVRHLADALDMDRTTLTRNLKPLIDAKLVTLAASVDDARVRIVRLTETGRLRHAEARRLWRRAQNDVDKTWGKARIASLHRLFDDLIESFNDKMTDQDR
jgi:DNA-binding MarR family transcriptional regulator